MNISTAIDINEIPPTRSVRIRALGLAEKKDVIMLTNQITLTRRFEKIIPYTYIKTYFPFGF